MGVQKKPCIRVGLFLLVQYVFVSLQINAPAFSALAIASLVVGFGSSNISGGLYDYA